MSKKPSVDAFQTKTTRNDRFAQMSHQEKVIEQKKKEIQARLDQKLKGNTNTSTPADSKTVTPATSKPSKLSAKELKNYNQFSNDGSFLNQFKQLKEKKIDQKLKSFRSSQDRNYRCNKNSRWSQKHRSPSPKTNIKVSRFSDKLPSTEPKINILASYSNLISQANFNMPQMQPQITVATQNVLGQPLLKNDITSPSLAFPSNVQTTSVIAAPPVMLTVPPPVLQQLTSPVCLTATTVLTTVTNVLPNIPPPNIITSLIPPSTTVSLSNNVSLLPSCSPVLELASIPAPTPIQIQNIPQPEPLNAHNIPPPAPLQVQNIPPPSPIQLNEIPNPKPLDVINIPTPGDGGCIEKTMSDPDFIKNIPPPNKSIPPPSLQDTAINVNISIPPPHAIHTTSVPPPQTVVVSVQNILPSQNIVVHSVPPPQLLTTQATVQGFAPPPPPPPQVTFSSTTVTLSVPNSATVGVLTSSPAPTVIPSLLAQPVLPPPGVAITSLPVNIHCPPPVVLTSTSTDLSSLPPSFVNQPPPITTQLPPVNIPPPNSTSLVTTIGVAPFKDLNAVCPSGTPEYEAMASLGHMVAQCGPGIEDIVRQRKPQDSNLWFLFHKKSAAYQQYLQLIEQFKLEKFKVEVNQENYKPEDIYEPEMATDDDFDRHSVKTEDFKFVNANQLSQQSRSDEDDQQSLDATRRKRKSRWGGKDLSVPPPTVVGANYLLQMPLTVTIDSSNSVMLSKITRNDPNLLRYIVTTYGSTNLSEEEWKKAEDNYKINLVYHNMLKKKEETERLVQAGKNKYEYDSDEETDGGTWEHKLRCQEMTATHQWAIDLTRNAEGKHHIGDFLPPDELKRFLDKNNIQDSQQLESDYNDFKLKADNVGFKMLQKLGWSEGQGLGANACGIVEPVNKGPVHDQNQGLGLTNSNMETNDDEYDAYRKRMMLAYRFRPNPLVSCM
ncbi:hypothetical protein FQA39_LY04863 [Lamprigera yunnana]|nr:hypothetical protein FQA39_LY04863 [Lamprigera yunnana]